MIIFDKSKPLVKYIRIYQCSNCQEQIELSRNYCKIFSAMFPSNNRPRQCNMNNCCSDQTATISEVSKLSAAEWDGL